jgi:cellulose synthase/poly-beta-1,6-N-acetylglucosamine synthase-like glycosyltransferase
LHSQGFSISLSEPLIWAAILIYLFAGPLIWALIFIGTFMARVRMGRLLTWQAKLPENPPAVTILIPAKDEGKGIRRCLDAVLTQDYPNFQIIAIDDRSTDETGRILDEIAARESRLRVIHIPVGVLPGGWLGKCHALHVGSREASGQWLLFVDSDVTLEPNALSMAMSISLDRGYDATSLLTRLETHSFLERLMLPMLGIAWAVMHTISWTNEDARKNTATANGQFLLIRRSVYESVGGHEAVKDQITEDVELMRLLKSREFTVRFFLGSHLAATRMHSSLGQMFNGWARIYSGTARRSPWRILAAMWFIIASIFSVYPAIALSVSAHSPLWLALALAHFALMTIYLMLIYHWSGNFARHALLIPVAACLLLAIFVYSLRKCYTGKIVWRDTEFVPPTEKPAA